MTAESAAQPTGLKFMNEINAQLNRQSPAALLDNRIVTKAVPQRGASPKRPPLQPQQPDSRVT